MMPEKPQDRGEDEESGQAPEKAPATPLISVYEQRPADYDGTCLRPLGLCELGGCCDTCWYGPDHPRHARDDPAPGNS
jgi:hypothetical protein